MFLEFSQFFITFAYMNIEITKKTKHKTEQMELVISVFCILNDVHLSKTEISVLAYYVVFGIKESTDALLINSNIINKGNLGNLKTKLKKQKFLKRTKELYKTYELNLSKDFNNDDIINSNLINLFIKIDNS